MTTNTQIKFVKTRSERYLNRLLTEAPEQELEISYAQLAVDNFDLANAGRLDLQWILFYLPEKTPDGLVVRELILADLIETFVMSYDSANLEKIARLYADNWYQGRP